MKIHSALDYATILRNEGRPVHLALTMEAPPAGGQSRPAGMAFCLVVDRSGSMQGRPLEDAKRACEMVVRNLRSGDELSVVVFDDTAEVVIPMQRLGDRSRARRLLEGIQSGGSTNLTAGWMLGRDELSKAAPTSNRRILLLSDGQLNVGIVDPAELRNIVGDGLERARIRTSTLGFGDGYDDAVLSALAECSGGHFYDANCADKLAPVFEAELEGLQKTASQNVRVRMRRQIFCESWLLLANYHQVKLPDGRVEISVGDLSAEESATLIFQLDVLPLPVMPDGAPAASLEGEALVEIEVVWDDLSGDAIRLCSHSQPIRIQGTQNPAEVKLNENIIPGIVTQRAGVAIDEALKACDAQRPQDAIKILREALLRLEAIGAEPSAIANSVASIRQILVQLEDFGALDARTTRGSRSKAKHFRSMKSHTLWTLDEEAPHYAEKHIDPKTSDSQPEEGQVP